MLQAILASYWLPEAASKNAEAHDPLFYFILAVNIFFSSLIMAMLIYFIFRYRHREGRPHDPTAGHSTALELTWTIIPTLLVLVIFYYGFRGYLHANVVPPNADEVTATGSMWQWSFTYPSGVVSPDLHIVVNRPTRITLESKDVIHDLDVPAFRMKKDVVPGRFNKEWFEPTVVSKPGEWYQVYCAMYCGQKHSVMLAKCIVQTQEEFDAWTRDELVWEPKMSFIDRGKELFTKRGCANCHSVEPNVRITGPSWYDVYGNTVELEGGATVTADDAYIEESILNPAAKIVRTYTNVMPSFEGQLRPNDLKAITWYLKSISPHYKGDLTVGKTVGAAMAQPATQPASMPPQPPK